MMKSSNENYRHAAAAAAHDIDNNHNKQMYSNNASSSIGKERSSASSSGYYTLAPRTFSSVPSRVANANANAKLSQSELDRHIGHSLRMRSKQQRQNTTTTSQHHLSQQQQQQQNDPYCTTIKDRQTMPSSSAAKEDRTVCYFMMEMDADVIDNDDNDDEHADYSNLLEQQQHESKDNIANPTSSPAITHSADDLVVVDGVEQAKGAVAAVAVPNENGVDININVDGALVLAEHNDINSKVDDEWLLLQILEYKCQCQLLEEEMLQLRLKKQNEQRQRRLLRKQRRQQRERLKKIKLIPPVDDDRTIVLTGGEYHEDDDEEQQRRHREMKRERRRQRRLQREQEKEEEDAIAENELQRQQQQQEQHPPSPPISLRHNKSHHISNASIENETDQTQHKTITSATKTEEEDDENEQNAVAHGEMTTEDKDDLDFIVDEIQQELLHRLHITKEEDNVVQTQAEAAAVPPDDIACPRVNEEIKNSITKNYDGFDIKFPSKRALLDAPTNFKTTPKLKASTTPKLNASTTPMVNTIPTTPKLSGLATPMVNATPTTPTMNSSATTLQNTSNSSTSSTTPTTCSTTASTPTSKPQPSCRFEFSPTKRQIMTNVGRSQQQRGRCSSSMTKSNTTIETVVTSSSMGDTPGDDVNHDVGMLSSPTPKKKPLSFLSSSSPFQRVSEVRQYCFEMSPPPAKKNNKQTTKTHSQDHPCLSVSSVSSITNKSQEEEKDNTTSVEAKFAQESVSEMRQRLDRERKHVELRHKMDILAAMRSPSVRTTASRRYLFGSSASQQPSSPPFMSDSAVSAAETQEDQKLQQSSLSLTPSLQGKLHQTLYEEENGNGNSKKRPPFFLRSGNNSNHKSNSATSHFYQERSSRSRAA